MHSHSGVDPGLGLITEEWGDSCPGPSSGLAYQQIGLTALGFEFTYLLSLRLVDDLEQLIFANVSLPANGLPQSSGLTALLAHRTLFRSRSLLLVVRTTPF